MSQEERLMILQMVADKKITATEGAELLKALDNKQESEQPAPEARGWKAQSHRTSPPPPPPPPPAPPAASFGSGLSSLIEEVFDRVTGVFGDFSGQRYEFPTEISGLFTTDHVPLRIFTGNGHLELKAWDQPGYKAQILVKARGQNEEDARRRALEAYLVSATEAGFELETNRRYDWSDLAVYVTLYLPREKRYRLEGRTGNGHILLEGLHFSEGNAQSGNGRITVREMSANRLYLKSGNGAVEVEGDVADLDASTGNGSIKVIPLGRRSEQMQLKTGNGSARIDTGRLAREVGLYIDAHTGMGSIAMNRQELVYERDERNIGHKHVIARSQSFDGAERRVSIRVRTGMGSISLE